MKNYSIKKYLPLLLVCILAGCFASKSGLEKPVDKLTLNVDEAVIFETYKEPVKIAAPQVLQVLEFKLGKLAQFEHNSTELTAEGRENLSYIAQELRRYPGAVFTIVGHTDTTGEESYNYMLSERRAQAIMQALQNVYGITNRIETVGKGPSEPKESNDTLAGRRANRRAEVIVSSDGN